MLRFLSTRHLVPLVLGSLAAIPCITPSLHAGGDVTWAAGTTQNIISNLHISSTLTIEEGVTVFANAGTTLFIESGGALIVSGTPDNPVLFTGNGAARWNGIRFNAGSGGSMTDAIIEQTNDVGIRIQSA